MNYSKTARYNTIDVGARFGILTFIKYTESKLSPSGQSKKYCLVRCDCGTEKEVRGSHLTQSLIISCGCIKPGRRTHGMSGTRLYNIWAGMKQRCYDEKCKSYRFWGAKGVTVCSEWINDFQSFYDWSISNGYKPYLTIDRVNNALIYSPETCEWVTLRENIRRRDEARRIRHRG